jgi:hypothetical protein
MPGSPDRMDSGCNWEAMGANYQVMYLVKRPSYEFVFAIPTGYPLVRGVEHAVFQVRFKAQAQTESFVLKLQELEDFYEGLGQLMEYIRIERQRWRGPL